MPGASQIDASQATTTGGDDERSSKVIAFFAKAAQNCSRIVAQDIEFLIKLVEDDVCSSSKAKDYLASIVNKAQNLQSIERQTKAFGVLLNDLPGAELGENEDNKAKQYIDDFIAELHVDQATDGQKRQLAKLDLLSKVVTGGLAHHGGADVVTCPISKEQMDDPFRNTVCGHAYDRVSIEKYIESRRSAKQNLKCPVEDCSSEQEFSWEILVPDPALRKAVDRAYYNEAMAEDDASSEAS